MGLGITVKHSVVMQNKLISGGRTIRSQEREKRVEKVVELARKNRKQALDNEIRRRGPADENGAEPYGLCSFLCNFGLFTEIENLFDWKKCTAELVIY